MSNSKNGYHALLCFFPTLVISFIRQQSLPATILLFLRKIRQKTS